MMPLAFAHEGAVVKVLQVKAGRGLARRLRELGIFENQLLRVVKSCGPGPTIVEVLSGSVPQGRPSCVLTSCYHHRMGGRILLGFGISMKILVEEVGNQ